jgi:hypothetical protein
MQMFAYKGEIDSNNRFYSKACRPLPPFYGAAGGGRQAD